jgi:DNA-binding LytR/AlgR family response regulator
VLKPTDPVRLARAIERVRLRLGAPPPDLDRLMMKLTRKRPAPAWLRASVGSAIHFIDLSEVIYFGSEFKYTRVVTDHTEAHIRTPLKELTEDLEEAGFWQIHRGFVVAVKRIAAVSRDEDGAMWLSLRDHTTRLPVSQRFQHRFKGM